MDIKTGLAIYNQPWLIEPEAAIRMLTYWEQVVAKDAVWDYKHLRSLEKSEEKQAVTAFQFRQETFRSEVVLSPTSRYDMRDFKGFEGARVALIPVAGPLMKEDFCGDFGTDSLRAMTKLAGQAKSVETIVFLFDTPGGAVSGTEVFANTIRESPKKTIGIISGLCCSAGYWLGSSCNELYATAYTDIIGSIGTMCMLVDDSKRLENMGIRPVEVYASRSFDKNAKWEEAIDGKPKRLIKTHLDPMNDVFLKNVQENRAGKIDIEKEDVLTGDTYLAEASIQNGLIDGVKSFDAIIENVLSKSTSKNSKLYAMSKPILAFGAVMTAAKATEFPVVEGGFLLTEEQLNNIEAKLDTDQVTATTTAASLKILQAQSEAFANAEKTASDLTAAQTKITDLQSKLDAANTKITQLEAAPGAEMAETTKKEDAVIEEPKSATGRNSFQQLADKLNY